jgi:hypothetical protein
MTVTRTRTTNPTTWTCTERDYQQLFSL